VSQKIPNDLAAEKALIIGAFQGRPMPPLEPDMFYDGRMREIWRAARKVVAAGKIVSLEFMNQYINTKIVPISDLLELDNSDHTVTDMEVYAKAVRGCDSQRKALAAAQDIIDQINKEPAEYAKPLESMVEFGKAQLRLLDKGSVDTGRSVVTEWIMEQEGAFQTKDMYLELGCSTPKQKASVRKTVQFLTKNGTIEAEKKRGSGWYRKRDMVEEVIDFMNVTDTTIDLRMPFGLDEMFVARPKNIIVIAGEPDSGKTALALHIARLNLDGPLPIRYFSSEMGPNEFRSRLDQFEKLDKADRIMVNEWKNIKVTERSEDFHDVIDPDGLNIIDFLEIHEDFWAVGSLMKKIFDKLDQGVCIVCIQKTNTTSEYGLGGLRGMEKPRLYLSIKNVRGTQSEEGYHTCTIVKCKSARSPEELNPTGLELDFTLARGCYFNLMNPSSNGKYWHRPSDRKERDDDNCFRSRF
jgi:archaellum biogenesis ATPase FlaH